MKASMVQDRVVETVSTWFGREPVVLESRSLDLAVALGAASFGLVLAGKGVRIRGGSARAYYVGVEGAAPRQRQGVCLIPFGAEAGDEVAIEDQVFHLVTDRPVSFPLFSSTAPLGHDAGDVVEITEDVFLDLPPLYTVLSTDKRRPGASKQESVEVRLGASLTELGTLQLWCAAAAKRWDLEFSLRGAEELQAEGAAPAAQVLVASPEVDSEALITTGPPDRLRVVADGALRGLDGDQGAFDLIYIDEDVSNYRRLLDLAMTRAAVQGVILLHGLPAEGPQAAEARAFCGYLLMHPQLRSFVLPVGDGLAVARKAQPLVTDLGGPY